METEDKILIRGETLSIDVYLTFDSGEPATHAQIPLNKIKAQALFQDGERIDLAVSELEESCWNLRSDIDTRRIKGNSFLVNVAIKPLEDTAPEDITVASMNETFYVVNSATRIEE